MKQVSNPQFNQMKNAEINTKQCKDHSKSTYKSFPKEDVLSPRGRQEYSNKSKNIKYKNSAYRNTSSSSNVNKPYRNRQGNKKANYYSDYSEEKDKFSCNIHDKKDSNKQSCSCNKCISQNEEEEENKLPKEIHQIIMEIYEAHINKSCTEHLVEKYYFSVNEFCQKEDQDEIIYLVRVLSEKLIDALRVSNIINPIIRVSKLISSKIRKSTNSKEDMMKL